MIHLFGAHSFINFPKGSPSPLADTTLAVLTANLELEWKDIHCDLAKYGAFIEAPTNGDKEALAKADNAKEKLRKSALIEIPALKSKTASRRFIQN